ncbi:asparagine synthetase B family protein [Flindersiella endophytica]
MCGITGWVSYQRDLASPSERATLEAMTGTMALRGPDASGVWTDRHAGLGHRRLAVIDLAGGAQPMTAEAEAGDGRPVTLVYSGEAYNYRELRAELRRRGHAFRTESDTEVVLRGYLEWGEAVAERLNGMYAFAIWDSRTETLVLVRDRLGIKPLYYYPTDDGVLFGSEPKAILANPLADPVVDLSGLRELCTMVVTPGHGVWAGMHQVKAGTVLSVSRSGRREQTYWRLETRQHTDDRDTTVANVRALLDDIVRRQLVADVPRCTLLSGGLDSSVMTALAARELAGQGEKVRSFSVDFAGQVDNFTADELRGTPDAPYAHEVAELAGCEHSDIVLDSATLADPAAREAVVRSRDLPCYGEVDVSLFLLFKAIRDRSTVALSGESADEVFAGYSFMHDAEVQQAATFPWLAGLGGMLPKLLGDPAMFQGDLAARLDLPSYVADSYATAVGELEEVAGEDEDAWRKRKMCYLEITRMLPALLERKDRLSMAVGLEVRVPYCDHRLVEYVYNTPWSLKTFDQREKSLLRHAARDVLPQSVVERVKSHYPSTQDSAYDVALRAQVRDLLSSPDHRVFELVDRQWAADQASGRGPAILTRMRSERVLNLATWMELYQPRLSLAS